MPARTLLTALIAALALALAPAAGASPVLPLGHAGRWVTDAKGRVVILHGFNMVYKLAPYAPDAIGFGDDDAEFLAAEGYNTVRVGVIYKAVEPQPGVYDDAYIERIADTIATLGRHGIVSMVDFHQDQYNERFHGEGWPDWAVQDDGLPNQPDFGFGGNYFLMPALWRAFDHFWNNDPGPDGVGLQDHFAAAWKHVAQRFRGNPDVLGYELLNEPFPGSSYPTCANPVGCPVFDATMTAFIKRTLAAIREVDQQTLFWYEPNVSFNYGVDTNVGAIGDKRLGFAFHDYCLFHDETKMSTGCSVFDDLDFANAQKHVNATGEAILETEFGATDDASMLEPAVDRADANMIGWQEWHYCGCNDPTTSGPGDQQAVVIDPAKPPEGSNLKADKLKILSRPYPQVVAGTPLAYGFDPQDKKFTLRYSTARADGTGAFASGAQTEIVLPRRQYTGTTIAVQGGAIGSQAGARLLRTIACPGAREVTVTVTPGSGTTQQSCPSAGRRVAHPLRVSIAPRTTATGRRVRVRVRVRAFSRGAMRPVVHATVRLAGARAFTDRRERATLRVRFRRAGRYVVTVRAKGLRTVRAFVTVR